MVGMTTNAQERAVPALTLGWRLQMALRHGGVTRDAMADYLGVTPSTISRWNGDKGSPPKRAFLAQWAMYTGVSLDWLETGEGGPTNAPDPGTDSDPTPKHDGDALARLTREKLSRARHAGAASTERYPQAA